MQAAGVSASVVMATNSGFSGQVVNKALADAIRSLTTNEKIAEANDHVIAASVDALKPSKTGEVSANQEVSVPSVPNMGKDNPGRGM